MTKMKCSNQSCTRDVDETAFMQQTGLFLDYKYVNLIGKAYCEQCLKDMLRMPYEQDAKDLLAKIGYLATENHRDLRTVNDFLETFAESIRGQHCADCTDRMPDGDDNRDESRD